MSELKIAKRLSRFVPLVLITLTISVVGQTNPPSEAELIRVRTRVVSFEAIVKNKRTGAPVTNLSHDNFEVRDENQLRRLTYFTSSGDLKQKPLALALVFDLRPGGAGRYLSESGPLNSLASALLTLPPQDEVSLIVTSFNGAGFDDQLWLTNFTPDRKRIVTLLSSMPQLVSRDPVPGDGNLRNLIQEISHVIATERPNSQGVILYVSDGLNIMRESDRNEDSLRLLQSNVTLYALLCHQQEVIKAGMLSLGPLFALGGLSIHNLEYLASQSGGQSLGVHNADDYGKGLETILGNLAARYSLGFTLHENEPNDGRLHRLTVKVKGRDPQGKKLNVKVVAPRGYYLPSSSRP